MPGRDQGDLNDFLHGSSARDCTVDREYGRSSKCCACLDGRSRSKSCGVTYAAITCLAPLVAAMSLGFTSPALDTMSGNVVVNGIQKAVPSHLIVFSANEFAPWFSALVNVGALVGAGAGGWLCNTIGQRNVLRASALLMGTCWAWVGVSSSGLQLCIARLPIGLGVGLQSVAAPSYISQVSPTDLRGVLGTTNAAAILLGVVIVDLAGGSVFRTGPESEFCQWRNLAFFASLSGVVVIGASLFLPSPADVDPMSTSSVLDGHEPESGTIRLLIQNWRLAVQGFIPMVWQQLSGVNAVVFFGQSILASAGISGYNVLGVAVICMQLLGIALAASLIAKVGRRPLLICSSAGMGISACLMAFFLKWHSSAQVGVVGMLMAYVLCFSIGLGPIPWLLLPELGLPQALRFKLASFATASNWACSFVVTGPPLKQLQNGWGLPGVFSVFGVVCLIGAILMLLLVPEPEAEHRLSNSILSAGLGCSVILNAP